MDMSTIASCGKDLIGSAYSLKARERSNPAVQHL